MYLLANTWLVTVLSARVPNGRAMKDCKQPSTALQLGQMVGIERKDANSLHHVMMKEGLVSDGQQKPSGNSSTLKVCMVFLKCECPRLSQLNISQPIVGIGMTHQKHGSTLYLLNSQLAALLLVLNGCIVCVCTYYT